MTSVPSDSQLDLIPMPIRPSATPGPMLYLDLAKGSGAAEVSLPEPQSPPTSGATAGEGDAFWLEGETLLCRCPDCRAPMSIRLWLLIADCWNCGTSIELSEEQERAIQRMLAKQTAPRRESPAASPVHSAPSPTAAAPAADRSNPQAEPPRPRATGDASARGPREAGPGTSAWRGPPAPARQPDAPRAPAQQSRPLPPRQAPAAPVVAPAAAATKPRTQPAPLERNWLRDWLKQTPAWLVSLIVHLFILLVLALWEVPEDEQRLTILLSTTVSRTPASGEFQANSQNQNEPTFELPIPDNVNLQDKRVREAMLAADQEARQLQLNPDTPAPQMADLRQVRELASSDDPIRRSLAVRDPRLRVEVVKREGGTTLTEAAVARALRWLARQQQPDGRWSERGAGWENAESALALLPFLGAGQTHFTGMYKDNVAKGLRWMIRRQKENGDLRGSESQHPGMYAHGIASIVLCDAFAMTGDEALRVPAQKALDFIVAAQSKEGGWRYFPKQDNDLSVVGWQLMALQSGRMSGLTVPDSTLELANQYLDQVSHENGALYSYQRGGGEARPTPAMTAEGLLCRMYLGWSKDEPGLVKGVGVLHANHLPTRNERNIYYWYYATQVFHHFGGEPWDDWNRRMRDLLVESQVTSGSNAGSWDPGSDRWGGAGGRIFITSLSACSLEVYYRHAPIYRQLELDRASK